MRFFALSRRASSSASLIASSAEKVLSVKVYLELPFFIVYLVELRLLHAVDARDDEPRNEAIVWL